MHWSTFERLETVVSIQFVNILSTVFTMLVFDEWRHHISLKRMIMQIATHYLTYTYRLRPQFKIKKQHFNPY